MNMAKQVLLVHQGDRNWKLVGIGVLASFLGLLLINAVVGLGVLLVFGGFITSLVGMQRRGRRCPSCRTQISRRAGVCPQCQQRTGFVVGV